MKKSAIAPGHPQPAWTTATRMLAAVAVLCLAVQVGVPAALLFAPRPARFGWHMFAGFREPIDFVMIRKDGTKLPVTLTDYVPDHRIDLETSRFIPAAVCARNPEASLVQYTFPFKRELQEYRCR